ncbi:vWA domain-containing protein [Actinoplanes sp. CA-142083]|uniref:vWA domain-containing protein n=1 Tax=Actinoplanes sp. CA-142083 TaxID=3239903 RepID=UPI003D8BE36C
MTVDALPVRQARNRTLITLVLDTSSSMRQTGAIDELNDALRKWCEELRGNDSLQMSGEIAMITFGKDHVRAIDPSGRIGGNTPRPYVPLRDFDPPRLEADGVTPMVEAIQYALEVLSVRRNELTSEGVGLAYRPMLHLITDGVPTDPHGNRTDRWRDVAAMLRQHEAGKHLLFFALGVRGADQEVLTGLAPKAWYLLEDTDFSKVLRLVSTSIGSAQAESRDAPADVIYDHFQRDNRKNEEMRRWLEREGAADDG